MTSIEENIRLVRERIRAAAESVGREESEIMLLGASKMNDAAACREAIRCGIDALGENRVQEMTEKWRENAYGGAPLHFIGHLQRNKVKQVVGRVSLIESVGSLPLLYEIEKEAEKQGLCQDILLECNLGGEEQKSGFSEQALFPAAETAAALSHIRVRGLMTVPPVAVDPQDSIPYFEKLRCLYVDIGEKLYDNHFVYLSMGMSGDFEQAIRCGATLVRVGSAIFGRRLYPEKNNEGDFRHESD